ncbi:MAG: hypothetical protein FWE47_03795, partial [Oscillospiraceae bacterium]|nr:hypothetical protein [Oscillospiraceae bacterium]
MQKIIPEISEVEGILSREDYGNTYSNMTRQTKEFYRKRVEEIAKKQKSNPFAIAKQACLLAQKKKRHVGYFLITTELGKTHGNQKAFHRRLYAFFIVLPTTLLLAFCGLCYSWWLAALALIPISEIVINIVNYITTKFSKPSIIPKMDFSPKNGGIPDEFKTQVVIPAFISSIAEAENLLKNLEIFSYANNDKNIFFTLICDCKPELQNETKEKTIEKLWELNKKLGENKFSLFLREIAWERKRGALMEYAQSIRGKFKYIITLDSDTKLNREVAAALIGAMAHPLNTPKTSKWSKRVMHGYGMMQPRMITDVQSANKSLFSKIFAGQGGIDSYSFAVSDIYQDLFEEGIFAGKGIFDVEAFCKILPGVIKENSLLSHDLLEGSFLRCALLGDVSFVDDFPGNYKAYSKRNHRWTRGDWQLLPYLKCKLSAISKWKIIDNLRRSLLPICLTTLLIISPKLFPLVLLILCTQLLISTIEWASNQGYKTSGKRFHSTAIHGLRGVFLQTLFLFITLLHTAISNIDAIVRTLWRVFVSHKNMLQWQTASQVESSQKNSIKSEFIFMWLSCVLALVLGILTANWLILLWIFAPLFTHKSGKIIPECKPNITDEDHHVLTHLAGRIWQYYEDFAIPKTNFLAPDNYQENPPNGIALRTSPTNIGMHILSAISAYDLGFIDLSKLISTLERILIAIAKLEKWHGNLYNWYDIETLKPLNPRYVSTVDSGNLLGYLMTAQAALEGIINSPPEGWQANTHCVKPDGVVSKLHSLLSKLQTLSDSMELRPLFDHSASLFSIGYDIEKQELTPTHYDILASEVRQTVYIAIARGEIPLESWAKMGRTLATHGGYRGLISWSGSMFEYLMPLLIMENVPNTLLNESYHFAIREQQRFAKTMVTPVWGVSESGFNKFDDNLNYQYKAFGVPALGVARSIQNDIVIAPYATCLALPIDYKSGIENIYRLNNLEFCGRYGFYEAVDYTPARLSKNENHAIVKQFMVHHLGMSLLSINNLLNDNILQKRFMSIPEIAAARELLCEKVPINVIISKETHHPDKLEKEFQQESDMVIREFSSNDALKYHVLSSHKSKTIIETSGKAFLNYDNLLLGSEERGSQIIINDVSFSENSSIIFAPPKAEFIQNRPDGLDITTTIFMANSFPAKLTKIFIANNSSEPREVNISMLTDIVLAKPDDHYAHPAFSKLFTKSKIIDDICLFERKGIHGAVYSVLTGGTALGIPHLETNRG